MTAVMVSDLLFGVTSVSNTDNMYWSRTETWNTLKMGFENRLHKTRVHAIIRTDASPYECAHITHVPRERVPYA